MNIVGIVFAVVAALFVLFHARFRNLSMWAAVGWAVGTLLLLIIVLPIYLFIHWPKRAPRDEDGLRSREGRS